MSRAPRSRWIGHFRDRLGLCIKTRAQPLIWKWFFFLMQNYSLSQERLRTWSYFEIEGFWNSKVAYFLPQLSAWQIIDLLATDRSRHFAQPRPIIVKYHHTCYQNNITTRPWTQLPLLLCMSSRVLVEDLQGDANDQSYITHISLCRLLVDQHWSTHIHSPWRIDARTMRIFQWKDLRTRGPWNNIHFLEV